MASGIALSGCGSSGPFPGDAVQSYLSDLAEGNYAAACGMLSAGARSALVAMGGHHRPCPAIYRRCLPSNPLALKHDQTQLEFDDVQSVVHGRGAVARVAGTRVAREIRRVRLVRRRGRWFLTFPGRALRRCDALSRGRRSHRHTG